jgi:curli biogenesis system outer membrane secretion channel CsgG
VKHSGREIGRAFAWIVAGSLAIAPATAFAQTAAKPAAAKPAAKPAAKASTASGVDTVIALVKGGMSESFVIQTLQNEGKTYTLSTADLLKLQQAGVSEAIMHALTAGGGAAKTPAVVNAANAAPAAGARAVTPFPPDLADVPSSQKRRLVVNAFDYATVTNWVNYWFNNNVNIGEGIRAMLTVKMDQSKNITLLERKNIQDVLKEQDFNQSNRVKKGSGARVGQLTGADAILYGDIVIFGRDDTTKRKGGGLVGGLARLAPGGAAVGAVAGAVATMKKEEKAVVGINLRLVDAETGEVIETAEARGESSRTSKDYAGVLGAAGAAAGSGGVTAAGGAVGVNGGMTSSNFQATIIGEATANAVTKIAEFLEGRIPQLPAKPRDIEGRIATINGNSVLLNIGSQDGVLRGDRFEILQINGEVKDPTTKEVIDIDAVKIGEFVADGVREKTVTGAYGGQPLSAPYVTASGKGYAARLMTK